MFFMMISTFTVLENPVIQGQNAGVSLPQASPVTRLKGMNLLSAEIAITVLLHKQIDVGVRQYEANENN